MELVDLETKVFPLLLLLEENIINERSTISKVDISSWNIYLITLLEKTPPSLLSHYHQVCKNIIKAHVQKRLEIKKKMKNTCCQKESSLCKCSNNASCLEWILVEWKMHCLYMTGFLSLFQSLQNRMNLYSPTVQHDISTTLCSFGCTCFLTTIVLPNGSMMVKNMMELLMNVREKAKEKEEIVIQTSCKMLFELGNVQHNIQVNTVYIF